MPRLPHLRTRFSPFGSDFPASRSDGASSLCQAIQWRFALDHLAVEQHRLPDTTLTWGELPDVRRTGDCFAHQFASRALAPAQLWI